MGTSPSSEPQLPGSLSHLTTNPNYQSLLLRVYHNNDQFSFNQVYYNLQNPNQSNDHPPLPIKIKKSMPQKTKLSLHKKTIQIVFIFFIFSSIIFFFFLKSCLFVKKKAFLQLVSLSQAQFLLFSASFSMQMRL